MWEPVGPLPASVYWRRRWVAIVSAVSVVALIAWCTVLIIAPPTPASENTPTLVAALAAQTAPQPVSPSPAASRTSPDTSIQPAAQRPAPSDASASTQQPGAAEPPASDPPSSAATTVSTEGMPATTSEEVQVDDPSRTATPATPVPVPPTGPVPCTNAMLFVGAEIDRAEHEVGERPVLRLVVMNSSDQPCVRDLDPARQEIVVWSSDGSVRFWSSNDCSNISRPDLRTLVPGQPVAFAVTWVGRTSTPGCAGTRPQVPAGNYRVMTRIDDAISNPTHFVRVP
ncbi:hypothetical protein WEH80_30690 [Actinomycetes bacterium KLBMP 9759]